MSSYVTKKTPGDTSWLVNDRFGMFIHFGLYSMPSRHEWVKCYENISEEKYDIYFKYFNPDMLDAKEWAKAAKQAGMKYVVLTTKHHEGFCLFDSKYTDYKVTNTPYGRDIVKEYVEAFRAEGLKIGFYYSLLDWHHPHFTLDEAHPRRGAVNAAELNSGRDMKIYAEYMRNQVTELLTNYGKIDIIWFDYTYPRDNENLPLYKHGKSKEDWESEKLIETIRAIQPDIVINNRTGIDQDTDTPEQRQLNSWPRDKKTDELLVWEVCHTFSGAWGYHRDQHSWKSPKMLIDLLINTVSYGGNMLMNVGPTSRGYFDNRAVNALKTFENWMKYNSRSIYGCTMAEPEFTAPVGTRLTQSVDGKRLYIHLIDYPLNTLSFRNLAGKIEYAQFLHDGSEILYTEGFEMRVSGKKNCEPDEVFFKIPLPAPEMLDPVIEVFLK